MGKRLNPHRRLLAAQARALMGQRLTQSAINGADMAKLQQGNVSAHTESIFMLQVTTRGNWEGRGTSGKVVKGQLKRMRPGTKRRFTAK